MSMGLSLATPEALRRADAYWRRLEEMFAAAEKDGADMPVGNCQCSSCQRRRVNIYAKYMSDGVRVRL